MFFELPASHPPFIAENDRMKIYGMVNSAEFNPWLMQWIKATEEKSFFSWPWPLQNDEYHRIFLKQTFLLLYLSSDLFWLAKVAEIYLSKNISSNISVLH